MALAYPAKILASANETKSSKFQKWLDYQAGIRKTIIIEGSSPINLDGPVRIPSGVNLIFRCDVIGNRYSKLEITGDSKIFFELCKIKDVALHIRGGSVTIEGLQYSGLAHLAAILIDGPGPYSNLLISNFSIKDANFGILRQGRDSQLASAVIRGGHFSQLRGDAIEWNLASEDGNVIIEDHQIDGISDPTGNPNWGIGIGLAGLAYDAAWSRKTSVKNFTIRNIRGKSLRQLIHVECGINFTISSILGEDICDIYSVESGMPSALVACYGCSDFVLDDIQSDSGDVLIYAGAHKQRFVVPCANFVLSHISLRGGSVRTQMGGKDSYARFERINLNSGILELSGEVNALDIHDIDIVSPDGQTEPIIMRKNFLQGSLASFTPENPNISMAGVRLRRGG